MLAATIRSTALLTLSLAASDAGTKRRLGQQFCSEGKEQGASEQLRRIKLFPKPVTGQKSLEGTSFLFLAEAMSGNTRPKLTVSLCPNPL